MMKHLVRSTKVTAAGLATGIGLVLGILTAGTGCQSGKELPNHGFSDAATLEKTDKYVIAESVGGKLDPANMVREENRYTHDGINYNRTEEGYYQWGVKMYELGYRDWFYVSDLEEQAFRRPLMDTYTDAIKAGYKQTEAKNSK